MIHNKEVEEKKSLWEEIVIWTHKIEEKIKKTIKISRKFKGNKREQE